MLQTMTDSSWNVHVQQWNWIYNFTAQGAVNWSDPLNGMTGAGSWKIDNGKLVTRWTGSKTWEEWNVPLDPHGATGKAHMQAGTFDLKAEARKIGAQVLFVRTAEAKAQFVARCNTAVAKVQIAQIHISGWLSSISLAYGNAFEAHNKVLKDIDATVKLAEDMLLGLALAFIGGGVGALAGSTVGNAMRKLGTSDADMKGAKAIFLIDGIKDLSKFAVRGPAGATLRPASIKAIPANPLQWQNAINERVMQEMLVVAQQIEAWRTAVDTDDDTFDASFDPAQVVDKTLVLTAKDVDKDAPVLLKNVDVVRIADLPNVEKDPLQKSFEQGWLTGWIKLQAVSNIPFVRDITRDKLRAYGKSLELANINALLDENCPRIGTMFPAGSLTP